MSLNNRESQVNLTSTVAGSLPIPGRREVFARLRSRGISPLPAAREAGYPQITPENARRMAQDHRIRARVAYLTRQEEEVLAEQRQILLERQWHWHDSDIADYFHMVEEHVIHDGAIVLKPDGEPLMRMVERLKPMEMLTRDQRLCIEGITWTERGRPNLKLYSKEAANKQLCKLLGFEKPTAVALEAGASLEALITASYARTAPEKTEAA